MKTGPHGPVPGFLTGLGYETLYRFCAATIANSIGMDSRVLVRENSIAVRADAALLSASASTMPSARFWFGH